MVKRIRLFSFETSMLLGRHDLLSHIDLMKFIGTIKQALEKIDPISKDSFQTHKCALNTITEQLY